MTHTQLCRACGRATKGWCGACKHPCCDRCWSFDAGRCRACAARDLKDPKPDAQIAQRFDPKQTPELFR